MPTTSCQVFLTRWASSYIEYFWYLFTDKGRSGTISDRRARNSVGNTNPITLSWFMGRRAEHSRVSCAQFGHSCPIGKQHDGVGEKSPLCLNGHAASPRPYYLQENVIYGRGCALPIVQRGHSMAVGGLLIHCCRLPHSPHSPGGAP